MYGRPYQTDGTLRYNNIRRCINPNVLDEISRVFKHVQFILRFTREYVFIVK